MSNGLAVVLHLEPLARHDLEDVARLDVLLALSDDALVRLPGEVRLGPQGHRPRRVDVDQAEVLVRPGEPIDQVVDPFGGPRVGVAGVDVRPAMGMGDDQDGLADQVEDHHPVVEGEQHVGQPAVVGRCVGQVLDVADGVVGGEPDRASQEPGQARHLNRPVAVQELLQLAERVVAREGRPGPRGVGPGQSRPGCRRASKRRNGSVPRKL